MHVVRCFDDPDVTHVMGAVDPVRDREVIEFELALADLAAVEKRLDRVHRSAKSGREGGASPSCRRSRARTRRSRPGKGLWEVAMPKEQRALLKPLSLLTAKPMLYAANVTDHELTGDEGPHLKALRAAVAKSGEHAEIVPFSAKIEAELAELPAADREEFLHSLGLDVGGTRPPDPRRL